jgi:hypothetical protein
MRFAGSLLSADPGVSFGRFMSLVATLVMLSWDTIQLAFRWRWNFYHLPVGAALLPLMPTPTELLAQVTFISSFYAITKVTGIADSPAAVAAVVSKVRVTPVTDVTPVTEGISAEDFWKVWSRPFAAQNASASPYPNDWPVQFAKAYHHACSLDATAMAALRALLAVK